MKTRILPALAVLPLLAACVEAPDSRPTEEAPAIEASAVQAQQAAAAVPAPAAPTVAAADPRPVAAATPVSNVTTPPVTPPQAREVLGAPPPAAEEEEPEVEEVSAEPAEPAPAGRLGTTVASLGSPTQGGLWLETALVDAPATGRIEHNGQTVTVELRPSGGEPGSGSQISVEAMRALGVPLTSLPELTVFAG